MADLPTLGYSTVVHARVLCLYKYVTNSGRDMEKCDLFAILYKFSSAMSSVLATSDATRTVLHSLAPEEFDVNCSCSSLQLVATDCIRRLLAT